MSSADPNLSRPPAADGPGPETEADRLRGELELQRLMLAELSHRVESARTAMLALLTEDIRLARDPVLRSAWTQARERLDGLCRAQAILHAGSGHPGREAGRTDLLAALRDLSSALGKAFDANSRGITIGVRGLPVPIPAEEAAIVLLIFNEVITNALRYAFRDRPAGGRIEVLVREADGAPQVTVRDDGCGISARTLRTGGAGLWLMRALARRLGADLRIERLDGTRVTLTLS